MAEELICRTCLSKTSKCISIYTMPSYCGKSFTISNMIMACAPIEITEGDGLPSKICDICMKLLQVSFMFRIRVLQANEKLKNFLRTKLVTNLQPVNEGFIEPLVLPSTLDEDIKQLFSREQVQQSNKDADPLFVDPLAKLLEQSGIKIEPENETLPIEEVMLPTDTTNFLAEKTDDLSCDVPIKTENKPLIPKQNANLLNRSPPMLNWINNSTNEVQNNTNQNTEYEENSNVQQLTDINLIQNILHTIQYNQTDANTNYIIVEANQANALIALNNTYFEQPKENAIEKPLCEQNTVLPSYSQSNLQTPASNTNDNLSNNTVNVQNSPNNNANVNFNKPVSKSFEDELKKFVENRQKYMQCRQDSFCFKHSRNHNSYRNENRIKNKNTEPSNDRNIENSAEKPCATKRQHPDAPASIDLTSDDYILPINDTSQNNSNVLTGFNGITVRNGDNKIVRLMVEEDQSSCIIIDD